MSTQMQKEAASQQPTAKTVDTALEVVMLPVADVDRSKQFYQGLGWRLDADFSNDATNWRVVQLTPPGSACSIQFGKGLTTAAPGSAQLNYLVVSDIEAARASLNSHGANVSELFHFEQFGGPRVAGPDPGGRSYSSEAIFSDPDGNTWLLQEIKTRLPGRGFGTDLGPMTELLREAEEQHGKYEPIAPKHHWSLFYAAYVVARQQGKTPEQAFEDGKRNVEGAGR